MAIDITISAMLNNTTMECESALIGIFEKNKIPEDLRELVLEKMLSEERRKKISLYSNALVKQLEEKTSCADTNEG